MTHIPPITREAREWLLEQFRHEHYASYMIDRINSMPIAPKDPLDAVRARWQSKTRGGQAVKIVAAESAYIFGLADNIGCVWRVSDGRNCDCDSIDGYDLVKSSPHAALIAELRKVENNNWLPSIHMDLIKRAADALEKQP